MNLRRGGGLRIRGPDSLGRCDDYFTNLFLCFTFDEFSYITREEALFFPFCFVDNGWFLRPDFDFHGVLMGGVYKWAMMSVCISLRRRDGSGIGMFVLPRTGGWLAWMNDLAMLLL